MQVPLLNGPATLTAYKVWAGSDPPAAVKVGFDKAQAVAAARKDLEVAVAAGKPADMDLLASYMAYVKLEQVRLHWSGSVRCSTEVFMQFGMLHGQSIAGRSAAFRQGNMLDLKKPMLLKSKVNSASSNLSDRFQVHMRSTCCQDCKPNHEVGDPYGT